jgi:hypothetical protein
MQECARKYIQLPQMPSVQIQHARVRSYDGMHRDVEMAPTHLHLSLLSRRPGDIRFRVPVDDVAHFRLTLWAGVLRVNNPPSPSSQLPIPYPNFQRLLVPLAHTPLFRSVLQSLASEAIS